MAAWSWPELKGTIGARRTIQVIPDEPQVSLSGADCGILAEFRWR